MHEQQSQDQTAIRTDLGAIFVSLELSRSTWLITSLSPAPAKSCPDTRSRPVILATSWQGSPSFSRRRPDVSTVSSQSSPSRMAGLDGFWIHRVLDSEGIESHAVDAASILTSRRRRQAKTDRIDGETLVRTLLAYKRGEPRVCSMVRPPSPEEEDRRRLCRERKTLLTERIKHTNRIKGLLCAQGIFDYDPLLRNRRARLDDLQTDDGRPLPAHGQRVRHHRRPSGWSEPFSTGRPGAGTPS
jgi:transposase